jgi:hypothetical protein
MGVEGQVAGVEREAVFFSAALRRAPDLAFGRDRTPIHAVVDDQEIHRRGVRRR